MELLNTLLISVLINTNEIDQAAIKVLRENTLTSKEVEVKKLCKQLKSRIEFLENCLDELQDYA